MKEKKLFLQKKETEHIQNKKFMKRIIDVIICLTKCRKAFRRHDKSLTSNQRTLF